MMPILFVDFDGTLCFGKYWRSLEGPDFERVQQFVFGQNEALVLDWMRGKHTAEEINHLVAKKLHIPYEKLWQTFKQDCETLWVSPQVLTRTNNLRNKFRIVLITDNMDSFSRFTAPALKLDHYFDTVASSFDYKLLKNDEAGAWFSQLLEKYKAPVNQSIVIDNSKHTCKTFETLGGKALFVTAEHPIDYWLTTLER